MQIEDFDVMPIKLIECDGGTHPAMLTFFVVIAFQAKSV